MNTVQTEVSNVFTTFTSKFTISNIIKYLVEGIIIVLIAYVIPQKRTDTKELMVLVSIAAVSLFLIDIFTPDISKGTRFGIGFGTGLNLIRHGALVL